MLAVCFMFPSVSEQLKLTISSHVLWERQSLLVSSVDDTCDTIRTVLAQVQFRSVGLNNCLIIIIVNDRNIYSKIYGVTNALVYP